MKLINKLINISMAFNIIEEQEDKLKVLLDCGDYFFKKKNTVITNLVITSMCITIIFLVIFYWNKLDTNCLMLIFNLYALLGMLVFLTCYAKFNTSPVIMDVDPNGITVKSQLKPNKRPIYIEKLNIKSIYVQVEKLDKYPIYHITKKDIYTIILKTKKSIQIQNYEKDKILLYRGGLTETQYSNWLEPQLNKIKKMLHLSTNKNIKVIKQYDKYENEEKKFW